MCTHLGASCWCMPIRMSMGMLVLQSSGAFWRTKTHTLQLTSAGLHINMHIAKQINSKTSLIQEVLTAILV